MHPQSCFSVFYFSYCMHACSFLQKLQKLGFLTLVAGPDVFLNTCLRTTKFVLSGLKRLSLCCGTINLIHFSSSLKHSVAAYIDHPELNSMTVPVHMRHCPHYSVTGIAITQQPRLILNICFRPG